MLPIVATSTLNKLWPQISLYDLSNYPVICWVICIRTESYSDKHVILVTSRKVMKYALAIHPITYAHGCDVVCFFVVISSVLVNSNDTYITYIHDDVIKWRKKICVTSLLWGESNGDQRIPLTGQRRGALMFSLICWTNGCANNRDADDLRHPCAHYEVTVMLLGVSLVLMRLYRGREVSLKAIEKGNSERFDRCDWPSILAQIGSKSSIILAHITLKFDKWPRKTIGQLFQVPRGYVRHFIAIREFKFELWPWKDQIGAIPSICRPVWPWNLVDELGKQ